MRMDVAVRDFARKDQLLFEAAKNFRMPGKFWANQFQCDQTLKLGIARFVDGAHTSLAEKLENFEAFGKDRSRFKLAFGGGFARGTRRHSHRPGLRANDVGCSR
jgi:hypothetical protein